jgi:hypothetical protein
MARAEQILDRLEGEIRIDESPFLTNATPGESTEEKFNRVAEARHRLVGDFVLFFGKVIDPDRGELQRAAMVDIVRTGDRQTRRPVHMPDGNRVLRGRAVSRVALLGEEKKPLLYADVAARVTNRGYVPVTAVRLDNMFRAKPSETTGVTETWIDHEELPAVYKLSMGLHIPGSRQLLRHAIGSLHELEDDLGELMENAADGDLNPVLARRLDVARS